MPPTDRVPLRFALIGAGSMGSNHARAITVSPRTTLALVVDVDRDRATVLADEFGSAVSMDTSEAWNCDAVVIAAPTASHFELAQQALGAGVPILVEKPLSHAWPEVERLTTLALSTGTPIMCGFVERFNPVIQTAASLLDEAPIHLIAQRHSPPAPRVPGGVIDDLLIHDIDIAVSLMGDDLQVAGAVALQPVSSGTDEIVDATLAAPQGLASLSASRLGQHKVRLMSIATPRDLFELDLLRQTITVYRHVEQTVGAGGGPSYRAQTIVDIPFVRRSAEPLGAQLDHFVDLVLGAKPAESEIRSLLAPHRIASEIDAATHRQQWTEPDHG